MAICREDTAIYFAEDVVGAFMHHCEEDPQWPDRLTPPESKKVRAQIAMLEAYKGTEGMFRWVASAHPTFEHADETMYFGFLERLLGRTLCSVGAKERRLQMAKSIVGEYIRRDGQVENPERVQGYVTLLVDEIGKEGFYQWMGEAYPEKDLQNDVVFGLVFEQPL